jgi:glycosyltransferase involved in cell wall biosynthesis
MKIAYCCADPGVPVFGQKGCSLHVQEMIRALRGLGADVTLFARRFGGDPQADLADVPVVALAPIPRESEPAREAAALAANDEMVAGMVGQGPFDLVYERYSLWSYGALEAAAAAGVPSVLEVNAPLIDEQQRYRSLCNREAAGMVARRAFAAADVLVAVSDGVADYLNGFPQARGRIHVVPNGVNAARFAREKRPVVSAAEKPVFTVGFVGTLKPWHGLDVLMEAFACFRALVPRSQLLIVGQGPEMESLQQRAAALGIEESVRFTGAVAPDMVPEMLGLMDVAVAPYPEVPDFYFSPLKVYEYMAAGLPVVASRIGQLTELIVDGYDGVLCPPGDAAKLCDALFYLHGDPGLRDQMGQAARTKVRAHHTWESVAQRILGMVAGFAPPQRGTGSTG